MAYWIGIYRAAPDMICLPSDPSLVNIQRVPKFDPSAPSKPDHFNPNPSSPSHSDESPLSFDPTTFSWSDDTNLALSPPSPLNFESVSWDPLSPSSFLPLSPTRSPSPSFPPSSTLPRTLSTSSLLDEWGWDIDDLSSPPSIPLPPSISSSIPLEHSSSPPSFSSLNPDPLLPLPLSSMSTHTSTSIPIPPTNDWVSDSLTDQDSLDEAPEGREHPHDQNQELGQDTLISIPIVLNGLFHARSLLPFVDLAIELSILRKQRKEAQSQAQALASSQPLSYFQFQSVATICFWFVGDSRRLRQITIHSYHEDRAAQSFHNRVPRPMPMPVPSPSLTLHPQLASSLVGKKSFSLSFHAKEFIQEMFSLLNSGDSEGLARLVDSKCDVATSVQLWDRRTLAEMLKLPVQLADSLQPSGTTSPSESVLLLEEQGQEGVLDYCRVLSEILPDGLFVLDSRPSRPEDPPRLIESFEINTSAQTQRTKKRLKEQIVEQTCGFAIKGTISRTADERPSPGHPPDPRKTRNGSPRLLNERIRYASSIKSRIPSLKAQTQSQSQSHPQHTYPASRPTQFPDYPHRSGIDLHSTLPPFPSHLSPPSEHDQFLHGLSLQPEDDLETLLREAGVGGRKVGSDSAPHSSPFIDPPLFFRSRGTLTVQYSQSSQKIRRLEFTITPPRRSPPPTLIPPPQPPPPHSSPS